MKPIAKPQCQVSRCPMCDSGRIRWVQEPCVFEIGPGRVASPPVPHYHCLDCGERLFDEVSEKVLAPWRESLQQPREPLGRKRNRNHRGAKTHEAHSR